MADHTVPGAAAQAGMSAPRLARMRQWIESHTGTTPYGCIVVRHGTRAAEWYGGKLTAESAFEIGSIRKSFNSALIGIGIRCGIVDLAAVAVDRHLPPQIDRLAHGHMGGTGAGSASTIVDETPICW